MPIHVFYIRMLSGPFEVKSRKVQHNYYILSYSYFLGRLKEGSWELHLTPKEAWLKYVN